MTIDFERLDPFSPPEDLPERHRPFFEPHVEEGVYFNPWTDRKPPPTTDLIKWQFSKNPWKGEKREERPVPPDPTGLPAYLDSDADLRVLWLGHASFLVGIGDENFLFDPVYGKLGPFIKRFSREPFPLEELPPIAAVFVSHGHYDHLDRATLSAIVEQNLHAHLLVPLGQERNLPRNAERVETFDWWERARVAGHEVTFVPTQHWHRRGLRDYNVALWGGWMLGEHVFHCGDSGYCDVFELLGRVFSPDVAMLPVGAFEPRWFMKKQHMNPEEALRAFDELRARHLVGMHWGTYDLTDEPRNLGAERTAALAAEAELSDRVHIPPPGRLLEFRAD